MAKSENLVGAISSKFYVFSIVYFLVLVTPNPIDCQIASLVQFANNIGIGNAQETSNGANTYEQTLGPGTSLVWTANRSNRTIKLTIESSRNGNIALALTKKGVLEGGDVVVVGAEENGMPFVLDMYGVNNDTIAEDDSQDWSLVSGTSNESQFSISIQRNLDTCDDQDVAISEELITVQYALITSNITPDFEPEGEQKIYFMDPYTLPRSSNVNVSEFQQWRLTRQYEMPPKPTSYWCSIHKMQPSLPRRHHISGFNAYFADEIAKRHVHHQILYRCTAPPGTSPEKIFEPFLEYPGEECYVNAAPLLPSVYCRDLIHTFGIGGEPVLFPESVGINIGGEDNSYFMLESHYDNPNRTEGILIEHGVDMYHTPQIRPDTGSILFVGHGALGTFVVPPRTSNFTIAGHCSKECSQQVIPVGGLDIIGTMLHAHTSTRRMRFRHFRGDDELPWILNDDEYDFQFQQIRFLESPRRVMPGDQLTVECGYDTHWKNGSAVASGFSTRDEMCMAFLLVNKPVPFPFCSSEYSTDKTMTRYGIRNMTWDVGIHERVINEASDPTIVGLTLSQVMERENWTPQRIRDLENEQTYNNHLANCLNIRILGGFYFYANSFNNFTGGILPSSMINQGMPASTVIRTPLPLPFPVNYPQNGMRYNPPPPVCPTQVPSANNNTNSLPTQIPGMNDDVNLNRWMQNGITMIGSNIG